MAKLKFGSIITEASGSLAGHTIQNSKGGPQLRTKPINKKQGSPAQLLIRSYNSILQAGWRNLSEANKKVWNNFAKDQMSGHSLWMSINYHYYAASGWFTLDPSKPGPPYLGPELIINGSFSSALNWSFGTRWSYTGNAARYSGLNNGNLIQTLPLTLNYNYNLKFYLSNSVGVRNFGFFTNLGGQVFAAPYNYFKSWPLDYYDLTVRVVGQSTNFRIIGQSTSSAFSIDNISLKRIY